MLGAPVCKQCLDDYVDAKILPWEGHASLRKLLVYLCFLVNLNLISFALGETLRVKFSKENDG